MKVRIVTSGFQDLAEARAFYSKQGDGVGDYFLDSLSSEIDSLALFGGIHRIIFGYHRLIAKRFPYAVYYRKSSDEIVVHRVLDCRRAPEAHKSALQA